MTGRPKAVTAVIFDLGATLIDFPAGESEDELIASETGCDESLVHRTSLEFSWVNKEGSAPQFVEFLHRRLEERGYSIELSRVQTLCDRSIRNSFVQDDAIPCLKELRRLGLKIAIVSNSNPLSHARIERYGLSKCVDAVRLSCDTGLWKPDPRAYLSASGVLGAAASDTLIVGDRIRTLALGAIGVGMSVALLDREVRASMLGEQLPFFAIFKSLSDLSNELGKA